MSTTHTPAAPPLDTAALREEHGRWPPPPWEPDLDGAGTVAERWTGMWTISGPGRAAEAGETVDVGVHDYSAALARYIASLHAAVPVLIDQVDALRRDVASLSKRPLRTFAQIGADRLADEVDVLVRRKVIDSRDPAADALVDYRDGHPTSARSDRMVDLEREVAELTAARDRHRALVAEELNTCRDTLGAMSAELGTLRTEISGVVAERDIFREDFERAAEAATAALLDVKEVTADRDRLLAGIREAEDTLARLAKPGEHGLDVVGVLRALRGGGERP